MLSFEGSCCHQYRPNVIHYSLSNVVDNGDDDDISGFLLGQATSHAALGGSWILDFPTESKDSASNPLLASNSCFLRHTGEDSGLNSTHPKTTGHSSITISTYHLIKTTIS